MTASALSLDAALPPHVSRGRELAQARERTVASGVRPEERLLLCMGDSAELLTIFLAGLHIGAVPVPVSTMLKPKDIAVLARDSRARLDPCRQHALRCA